MQPGKKLTEQEQWEAQQLKASGVLTTEELPTFDDESGNSTHLCLCC